VTAYYCTHDIVLSVLAIFRQRTAVLLLPTMLSRNTDLVLSFLHKSLLLDACTVCAGSACYLGNLCAHLVMLVSCMFAAAIQRLSECPLHTNCTKRTRYCVCVCVRACAYVCVCVCSHGSSMSHARQMQLPTRRPQLHPHHIAFQRRIWLCCGHTVSLMTLNVYISVQAKFSIPA